MITPKKWWRLLSDNYKYLQKQNTSVLISSSDSDGSKCRPIELKAIFFGIFRISKFLIQFSTSFQATPVREGHLLVKLTVAYERTFEKSHGAHILYRSFLRRQRILNKVQLKSKNAKFKIDVPVYLHRAFQLLPRL